MIRAIFQARHALVASLLVIAFFLTVPAQSFPADADSEFQQELASLRSAIQEFSKSGSAPGARAPAPPLPSGTYNLCILPPHHSFRNMVERVEVSNDVADVHARAWIDYLNALEASFAAIRRRPTADRILPASAIDRSIRSRMSEFFSSQDSSLGGGQQELFSALLWSTSCLVDRESRRLLLRYLPRYGWPPMTGDMSSLSHAAFLLFQHAPFSAGEKEQLIGIVESGWREGRITGPDYARIVDRYLEETQGHQLYGTQTSFLQDSPVIDNSIDCRSGINERRATLGLDPLPPEARIRTAEGEECP